MNDLIWARSFVSFLALPDWLFSVSISLLSEAPPANYRLLRCAPPPPRPLMLDEVAESMMVFPRPWPLMVAGLPTPVLKSELGN